MSPARTAPRAPATGTADHLLPSGPTDAEKYWYLGPQRRWVLLGQTAAFLVIAFSLANFALQEWWLWPFLALLGLQLLSTGVGTTSSTRRRRMDRTSHQQLVDGWAPEQVPAVDVFLPSAGEPLHILENTFAHVAALAWAGPLKVHVLDDSARPEVADLAASYEFTYHTRPDRGRLKKAGNLAYGYARTDGDLIAIFDADFCPRPDFLTELVPYFDEAGVGIVQSPQFFDTDPEMNWLQRTAGATQELFYRWVQPSRDAVGAAICVGTNAIYRRTALEAAGGFAQIGHSEDVHTGVNLLKAGYSTRYVPVLLAKGLCPDELNGFISQQYRWCTGSMSLLVDRTFHQAPLTLRQRMSFWSGFLYYITTAINVFTGALPVLVMVWLMPEAVRPSNYLPLLGAAWVWLVLLPASFNSRWRLEVLRVQQVYSFAHAVAIWHLLRGRTAAWVPTGAAAGRSGASLARTVKTVMWTWVVAVQVATLSGLALASSHYGWERFWPAAIFESFTLYVVVPLLLPVRTAAQWRTWLRSSLRPATRPEPVAEPA